MMTVLQRMHRGGIRIFSTMHKTLAKLRMYVHDENGIPVKGNDHFMDCMRYIIASGLGIALSKAQEYVRRHPPPSQYYEYDPQAWMRL